MAKCGQAVEDNEIDGEVLGTFDCPGELCEHTGLELVPDVARCERAAVRHRRAAPQTLTLFSPSPATPSTPRPCPERRWRTLPRAGGR